VSAERTAPDHDGIAIVGLSGIFPGAADIGAFWDNIRAGVDATSDVPTSRWDPVFFDADAKGADRFYCRRGGFIDDLATFDPLAFGIMPVAMETAEPDQLLALSAASAALHDAGAVHERVDPRRVAVILGRGGYIGDGVARLDQRVRTAQQLVEAVRSLVPGIDEDRLQQMKAEFQDRLGPERPEGSIGLVPNLAASRIANRFDFRGPAYTVDAACASSLIAVDQAVDQLRSGRADVVLAGGVHHCHDLTLWSVFCQLRALSPTGEIRPFSEAADGILVGEGTGILVLKRLADAERDGDRTYAVIRGTGVASDGSGASLMSPAPAGQVLAVEQAWRASGLDPADVGLIEAHGTATPVGDRIELETLRTVFGAADASRARAGLGSVKSMIGHAMPAAGAAGLAKAALAVFHGELPPTLHVDEPNTALADTRFRLITEVEPWEGDRPRLAGVNAFGFGGINAHVVLAEPPGLRSRRSARSSDAVVDAAGDHAGPSIETEEVLLLAGADAADLLRQLDGWTAGDGASLTVPTGGPARLAIVAPDDRRLQLARKVLERGTPFRGRNDVWFDPTGLLTEGGKVAFLFPGVEPVFDPKVDDVAAALDLPWEGLVETAAPLERQGRGIVAVGRLLASALGRLGVKPDLMAGHSLGEWTGQIASGMIPDSYVEAFLGGLRPGSIELSDVVFVALGCGADVAAELVDGLPDAYVSHDNCPHQSVICAPAGSIDEAVQRAKERKVLAQELPFRSGFHSPLFAPFVRSMGEKFGSIPLRPAEIPMWSATIVAPYPDEPAAITELAGRHLVEPVRFRELAHALYDDGARVFVQVGTGSLMGFVDDTLRDEDFLGIAANVARQSGLGQLRRVAAALWSAGADIDFAPLGHEVERAAAVRGAGALKGAGHPVRLPLGSPLIRDLTPLPIGSIGTDVPTDVAGAPAPLLAEFNAALNEATAAVHEVLGAAQSSRRSLSGSIRPRSAPTPPQARSATPTPANAPIAPIAPTPAPVPAADPNVHETVLHLSVADQPWWGDHAFYEQPDGWPCLEDEFPLVPMTAIIEMLATEAEALVPGTVTVAIESVRAFRWLAVEPAADVAVRATLDVAATDARTDGITVVRSAIDGHARATVLLAPAYAASPAPKAVAVNGELPLPVTVERLYEKRHLFHGPAYQGIKAFDEFGTDGVVGRLETKPFPGSLLDNAGQLFGFWVATAADRDRLVLPTSIDRISYWGPHPAAGTEVHCVVNVTEWGDQLVRADLELTVDGQVWCRIEGWEDRRFQSDDRLFLLLREPADHALAERQPGGWVLVREGWPDSASRDVVMRRFLGQDERVDYQARNPNVQRTWLLGRIAAKDAVRDLRWQEGVERIFPIEIQVRNDESGRPTVQGPLADGVHISIAHTDGLAVAMAAVGVDVGIDIERVEPRPPSFLATALTDAERTLLDTTDPMERDRTITAWWAAKEAVAKARGTGMEGRPRDFEVAELAGSRVRIGARWVDTETVLGPERNGERVAHVVAWTVIGDDHQNDAAPTTTTPE